LERSATTLLDNARYDLAYHAIGIAVECALKAKIATLFRANDVPEKKLVEAFYNQGHDLAKLVGLAQLGALLTAEEQASATFRTNWATVKAWTNESRYKSWSHAEATALVKAATQRGTGVLSWIRRHW
jgi:hypothetical protein